MLEKEKIRELLKDRNLRVVAEEAEVSYYALTYWVRENQPPSFRLISQLSDYLEKTAKKTIEE
jgi:hypothetical protein